MKKYRVSVCDAAADEDVSFERDGDDAIMTSDFIVACVDSGVFIDAVVESPCDIMMMVNCLFCAGEEVVGKVHPDIDKEGVYAIMCLAHSQSVMRHAIANGGDSVGADMILLYDRLRKLLDETDIEGYIDRCINGVEED